MTTKVPASMCDADVASQAELDVEKARITALEVLRLTAGTATTLASGVSVDFTGIPTGAQRITLSLAGVSTNGTSDLLVQIGDAGGIENSGYLGAAGAVSGGAVVNATTGFVVSSGSVAASVHHGTLTLTRVSATDFTWALSGSLGLSNTTQVFVAGGSKSLSATLDRIRLTTVGGTAEFDAGVVNITYE